ncbi:hypothetical protein SCLCIDRAFT_191969 [Scleroderma citrinum Foug A]|uniref:Uncharacterized protein n=1 Tax=Scleroderma citrinum Foug A TaxID=1036808 RepID=A0A0C3DL14_9AGAM|nr:hypothetical protein SCLCIDRAFT_191969 [Scleroderma citrinum Foug A]
MQGSRRLPAVMANSVDNRSRHIYPSHIGCLIETWQDSVDNIVCTGHLLSSVISRRTQ